MSTLNVSNITDGTDTVETGYVLNGSAKVWAHFDFGGTIEESLNVSSLTDNTTGRSSLNFTSNMNSSTYSIGNCPKYATSSSSKYWCCIGNDGAAYGTNTTKVSLTHLYGDQNEEHFWDANDASASILGDLA